MSDQTREGERRRTMLHVASAMLGDGMGITGGVCGGGMMSWGQDAAGGAYAAANGGYQE